MINARAESLAEKPSFKQLLGSRRCLIPANGFYEWRREGKGKVPMRVVHATRPTVPQTRKVFYPSVYTNAESHGFLKDGATFITIDVPGALFTGGFDVNDSGQIVGDFQNSSSDELHGFLATPVSEPSALFLLTVGLVGLGMAARKRRGKSFL